MSQVTANQHVSSLVRDAMKPHASHHAKSTVSSATNQDTANHVGRFPRARVAVRKDFVN